MKRITISQLHAETRAHLEQASRMPVEVTAHGKPIAIITGVASPKDVFGQIRAMRLRLTIGKSEKVRDLIGAGRRLF